MCFFWGELGNCFFHSFTVVPSPSANYFSIWYLLLEVRQMMKGDQMFACTQLQPAFPLLLPQGYVYCLFQNEGSVTTHTAGLCFG